MIQNDERLRAAQQAIFNLEKVLLEARKIHSAAEYRVMSESILLEIQQREQEVLSYLATTRAETSVGEPPPASKPGQGEKKGAVREFMKFFPNTSPVLLRVIS
jgi:hypothetical protein